MQKIETEHGIFTNNEITKQTAQEVYDEWLKNKDEQIDICPVPTDQERISKLEEEKSILAENVYQLANIIEAMLGDVNNE